MKYMTKLFTQIRILDAINLKMQVVLISMNGLETVVSVLFTNTRTCSGYTMNEKFSILHEAFLGRDFIART